MSVLVRGMKMPNDCPSCYLQYDGYCDVADKDVYDYCDEGKRPDWCPLIELPEKHDALIDRKVLCKDLTRFYDNERTARDLIYEQPVVIEAEEDK